MKAKKVNTFHYENSTVIEYEYRNHTYEVEYANNWTFCVTPPYIQHKNAQARIDKEIENESKSNVQNSPYEEGFEMFWDYVNF